MKQLRTRVNAHSMVPTGKEPEHALEASVLMTLALIRLSPSPVRRVVGTLSQTMAVLQVMGIETRAA